MENQPNKLRPIVYTQSYFKRGHQNTAQQLLLLKCMQVTQDPEKLRKMMHFKRVAEVYQTLDKIVMRKEYHDALSKLGISFEYIAGGIKGIAETGEKDADKLKALQILLKSIGMDKYDTDPAGSSGTWEEELLKSIEVSKDKGGEMALPKPEKYDVKEPEIPESARIAQEDEDEMTSSIYEKK